MYLVVFAIFAFSSIAFASGTLLQPAKPIVRELSGGQKHIYRISLAKDQYAGVIIEQRGIDVVLEFLGTHSNAIASFDNEFRSHGEEKIEMVSEAAGSYRLSVNASSLSASAGQYQIRITEIRAASENDRLLHEARKLEAESRQALLDGYYQDARQLAERALAIAENILGPEHPFVATLLMQLSNYYDDKQDFAKAISLVERALAIRRKTLGEEHPHTIDVIQSLAYFYYSTNEIAKAEPLAQRAIDISEKTLGSEHALVRKCLVTLAKVTNEYKKVEQLLERALMIAEKTEGAEHYHTGTVLNQLGYHYTVTRDYERAEKFFLRSQAIYEKTVGAENISRAINLHNLGLIAREKKDYSKAQEFYAKATAIVEKAFGPENPRLAIILNNVANIYRAGGDYEKSLEAHHRVLQISETTKGSYQLLTMTSLGNIAKTYAAQGNIVKAIKFQARVDAVIERNIEMQLAIGSEREKISFLNSIAERTDRTISLNRDLAPDDLAASELAALVLLQRKGRALDAMSETFASLRQRSSPEEQALLKQFNDVTAELGRLVLDGPQKMSVEEHKKRITELEEQKETLEAEISRRSAEFRAGSQPVTVAAIQSAIPGCGID